MQPFLAFGCVAGAAAAFVFFLLWRSAEAAVNDLKPTNKRLSDRLRQRAVEVEQLKLEITRRQEADDFQASKRSANVSKGNRTRAAKRAARLAAQSTGSEA